MTVPTFHPLRKSLNHGRQQLDPKVPYFGKCFCWNLKTGCLLYGWMNMLFFCVMLAVYGYVTMTSSDDVWNICPILAKIQHFIVQFIAIKLVVHLFLVVGAQQESLTLLKMFLWTETSLLVLQDSVFIYMSSKNAADIKMASVNAFTVVLIYTVCVIFMLTTVLSFISQLTNKFEQRESDV